MLPFVIKKDDLILDYSDKNSKGFSSSEKEPVLWRCHICGHEWAERIDRRLRGSGCPACNLNAIRHLKMRGQMRKKILD